MNLNRKPLLLAIVAGMLPSTGVFAGPLNDLSLGTTPTPISIPSEAKESSSEYFSMYSSAKLVNTATVAEGGDMDVYIYTMPGYVVKKTEAKNLIVKVALTGGAKFTKTPYLVCAHSGIGAGLQNALSTKGISAAMWSSALKSTTVTDYAAQGMGAGGTTAWTIAPTVETTLQASYSYSIPDGFNMTNASSGACILSFSAAEPYRATDPVAVTAISVIKGGAAGTEINMTTEVTYDDFFGKKTATSTIPIVRFVTAYKAEFTQTNGPAANTAAAPIIDVTVLSKKFKDGSVNALEAFAGYAVVTASVAGMRGANGIKLSATDIVSSATLTFGGNTINSLSKVTLHLPTVIATNGCKGTVAAEGKMVLGTGGTASDVINVAINTQALISGFIASATVANQASGFGVCLVTEGTTNTMSPGYVTLTVAGTSSGGKAVELGSTSSFVEVKRNGTVVRVLNVPGKASDPYQVNVRMYNVSSTEVTDVKGTLYGVDGKSIADVTLADKILPNNMKLVKSADLIKLVGKEWEGRAWLLIQAPVSSDAFRVQVLMKNPTGELANLSADSSD